MKALLAHDHRFIRSGECLFSNGGLSAEVLQRYASVFDGVTVVSRQIVSPTIHDGLTPASTDGVSFVRVPDFLSPRGIRLLPEAYRIIGQEVKNSHAVIARLPSEIGQIAIKMARRYDVPTLVELVGDAWGSNWHHGVIGKLAAPASYLRTRSAVRRAPFVIYITDSYLQRQYPTYGRQIGCSNVQVDAQSRMDPALRHPIDGLRNGPILIGSCGAVNVRLKGHHLVVKAIPHLVDLGYDVRYEVVGGGDGSRLLTLAENLGVSDRLRLWGSKPHDEVNSWMNDLDIYVQPSLSEGQGRALVEAMTQGCACVCADVGGMKELVEKEFRFRRGNVNDLSAVIAHAIANVHACRVSAFQRGGDFQEEVLNQRRNRFLKEFRGWAEVR